MMSLIRCAPQIFKLSPILQRNPPISCHFLQGLHTSPALLSAVVKRKKKLDPALEKAREDRRRKRVEKAIRKMERKDRIPRPILELEVPTHLVTEREKRSRGEVKLSDEEIDRRELLKKEWNRFSGQRHRREIQNLDRVLLSQQKALDELRSESEELYFNAIQFDETLQTFTAKGPTRTPPIKDHILDGEYVDKTKVFEVQYTDMKKFMAELLLRNRRKKKRPEEEENE